MEQWHQVEVTGVESPNNPATLTWGEELEVRANVRLGGLTPEDVACDIYYGPLNAGGGFQKRRTETMQPVSGHYGHYQFAGRVKLSDIGRIGLKVRIVPNHPDLSTKYALGLAAWG